MGKWLRRHAVFWLAFALAACSVPSSPDGVAGGARPAFYRNQGPAPPPRPLSWAGHLLALAAKVYPQAASLPPGHVLGEAEAERQFAAASGARLSLTWFGHSTFLVRMGATAILTDPVLADRVGPDPFHVHRMVPVRPDPGIVERLDAIVVSHADFDHLDLPTLAALARRFPEAEVFVPSGTGFLARRAGFRRVTELGWWDEATVGGVTLTGVPAIHGVRRPPFALDSMHWNGFHIADGSSSLYFSGDTAAGPVLSGIRDRLGPVDFAIVPAGAWAPREFQLPYHASPEEAAGIARMLGARLAVGMHWGTFALSPDPPREQMGRFLAAGTPGTPTAIMRIGETRVLHPATIAREKRWTRRKTRL